MAGGESEGAGEQRDERMLEKRTEGRTNDCQTNRRTNGCFTGERMSEPTDSLYAGVVVVI